MLLRLFHFFAHAISPHPSAPRVTRTFHHHHHRRTQGWMWQLNTLGSGSSSVIALVSLADGSTLAPPAYFPMLGFAAAPVASADGRCLYLFGSGMLDTQARFGWFCPLYDSLSARILRKFLINLQSNIFALCSQDFEFCDFPYFSQHFSRFFCIFNLEFPRPHAQSQCTLRSWCYNASTRTITPELVADLSGVIAPSRYSLAIGPKSGQITVFHSRGALVVSTYAPQAAPPVPPVPPTAAAGELGTHFHLFF